MNIRFIAKTKDSVTLSRRDFDALMEELEDTQDLAAYRHAKAERDTEFFPSEMVERMLAGENLVRLWREHRGMTARALADKAMVDPGYLSEIEGDHKPGSVQAMARLARALGLQLGDLVRGDGREKARAKPSKNVFPKHVKKAERRPVKAGAKQLLREMLRIKRMKRARQDHRSRAALSGRIKGPRIAADRSKVAGGEAYEVAYFAKKHGISAEKAKELIARHGNDRATLDAAAAKVKVK